MSRRHSKHGEEKSEKRVSFSRFLRRRPTHSKNSKGTISAGDDTDNMSAAAEDDTFGISPQDISRVSMTDSPVTQEDENGDSSETDNDDGILDYNHDDIESVLDTPDVHKDPDKDIQPSSAEQKIKYISRELLSTEETYVRKLGLLLQMKKETTKTLSSDVAKKIFPNIEAIHSLHHDNLLPALRERIQNWEQDPRLGDIMCRLTPFLKLYTEYVKNFDAASQLARSTIEKSAPFTKIFPKQKSGSLGMDALMIEPIQRVPRYELLLKDYLKRLTEDSLDREDVSRALDQVTDAAGHFEKMMKRDAQILEVGRIQSLLVGDANIFSLSRELLKEMEVFTINSRTGLKENCILYVFNDILLVVRAMVTYISGSLRLRTKHMIDLSKIKVSSGINPLLDPSLELSTRKNRIELGLRSTEELSQFKELLRKQMADTAKRKLMRRGTWNDMSSQKTSSLGNTAPQFVPPHTVSVCMVCGEHFTSPKKKKHCSACGMVVCGACSCHQVSLLYSDTPQRVCQKCYPLLSLQRQSSAPTKSLNQ